MDGPLASLPTKDGFRLRGTSVTRLETFVDAAFAFAATMLVISVGSIPSTLPELSAALRHIPTFAACFYLLTMLWSGHDEWSRRYGLDTSTSFHLSLLLVLGVLVWVYPLRVVIGLGFYFVTQRWVPSEFEITATSQIQDCFLVYSIGYAVLNAILWQLNRHALKHADELQLDAVEVLETKRTIGAYAIRIAVSFLSIALTFPLRHSESWLLSLPGFVYMLTGPLMHFHHARFHRLRAQLSAR